MLAISINTPFYRPLEKEGGQLSYFISEEESGNWELIWCATNPTPSEIKGFQEGRIEYRLAVVETIPFFCFRVCLEDKIIIPWNECPFNGNLIPKGRTHFNFIKVVLETNSEIRLTIPLIVIDYQDYLVKSLRYSSLSVDFSKSFVEAILGCHITNQNFYSEVLNNIYEEFSVGEIAEIFSVCQCNAGD
ncbi:MAG: hypothetical protein EA365_08835 [Gloeocapsa sp. DLM2.Bin57]|nr:MAG: hypothetical protein EA365_08835 [Gloeocapsa sp. DLM2.Bin57]